MIDRIAGWMGRAGAPLTVGVAAIVLAASTLALHVYPRLPPPGGRFHVGTVAWDAGEMPASDARDCRIKLQLWYPAEPGTGSGPAPYSSSTDSLLSAERWVATDAALNAQVAAAQASYPVLLYFPGWDGALVAYTAIAQDLASHGFIVVAIGYESTDCALPDGEAASGRGTDMDFSSQAAFERTVRIADTKITRVAARARRVLDALAELDRGDREGRFTGRLDLGRLAAIGHSLGGAIALQLASLDPRIKAAIDIDGWVFDAAPGHWTRQPFLIMDSEAGSAATPDPGAGAPEQGYPSILDDETDRRMHAGFAEYGGVEVTIGNSAHEDFTDAPYLSRKAALLDRRPDGHAIRIAVECTATFFDAVFRGQDSPSCETGSANTRIKVWRPTAPDAPAK